MSEAEANLKPLDDDEPEETPGYVPPAQKTWEEIQNLDADDEALVKYKQTLLGVTPEELPKGPKNVVVEKVAIVPTDEKGNPVRDPIELDLIGDISKLKDSPITIKEGTYYKIKIIFKVYNDQIISGLRLHNLFYRKGIRVTKDSFMVGSYGPKFEPHEYLTPIDEAPKGMMARGKYIIRSKFIDDDKNSHLEWEWAIEIKKDWQ
ncbi:predicted protein [Nematostella vectensis]|uniref:Rho GDP-dissociation inhibitor 3 n=1 Tax=Nematostella vectensis TaxID=45351 RepID=A7SHH6_NEMVE|nr:rho GDP-dissociation inhibitor 1 [Nematostella vectensis]EDO36831.1 predicted protein [Nematostella vectensis]|eukprot:XP_001628894.1 predicted protein [Nematostella vectensis]